MPATNASPTPVLAANMQGMTKGRFIGLITTLKGKNKGRGAAKKLYGDATMHYVLYFGFNYGSLVMRSRAQLEGMDPETVLEEVRGAGLTGKSGADLTMDDVVIALADLKDSFDSTAAGTSRATTADVFEPLVVDGERVPNCRVYIGDKAEEKGTIYLQGLVIGRKCLEPAPNGPIPAANSRGDVVVKNWLRSQLPIGKLRQFILKRDGEFLLRAEGATSTWLGQDALDNASDVPVDMSQVA